MFTSSRSWNTPKTVLHLSAGKLSLMNVIHLVAENYLASKNLLFSLQVLCHYRWAPKSCLERSLPPQMEPTARLSAIPAWVTVSKMPGARWSPGSVALLMTRPAARLYRSRADHVLNITLPKTSWICFLPFSRFDRIFICSVNLPVLVFVHRIFVCFDHQKPARRGLPSIQQYGHICAGEGNVRYKICYST